MRTIEEMQAQVDAAGPVCEEALQRARAYETDEYPTREDSGSTTILAEHFQVLIEQRDRLRTLLVSGIAYVRDANQLLAADGNLDEDDEDGANEWLAEARAAALT